MKGIIEERNSVKERIKEGLVCKAFPYFIQKLMDKNEVDNIEQSTVPVPYSLDNLMFKTSTNFHKGQTDKKTSSQYNFKIKTDDKPQVQINITNMKDNMADNYKEIINDRYGVPSDRAKL